MKHMIYLDNAATTRVKEEVLDAMLPFFRETYSNPSAIYSFAGKSMEAVNEARKNAAALINARPEDVYFTGGGSESDNWALKAAVEAYACKGKHIITSKIEHHAILHTCQYLEKQGCEVTYLDVDENGVISLDALEKAIRPDTILISIMTANNEIGTIEPIAELAKVCKARGVLFHTDAVQAIGSVKIDVKAMQIDMLSMSGHKFHAPKGIGVLYIRKGVRLQQFMNGGAQERNRRAGTENLASIVGIGKAIEIATANIDAHNEKLSAIRDHMIERILKEIPYTRLNGHPTTRLPGNVNVCFRFIEGESLLMLLDAKGIAASSGSACTSGSLDPSHVLLAIGLPHEIAHGSLRLSLSEENTMEEADFVVDSLVEIVARLRSMSPLYDDFIHEEQTK